MADSISSVQGCEVKVSKVLELINPFSSEGSGTGDRLFMLDFF